MAQDTLLGFPAHTLPYRRGEFTTLSTVSALTRLYAASELFAQRIDHPDKKKQEESGRKQAAYQRGFFLV